MLSLRTKVVNRGFSWPIGTVVYSLEGAPAVGLLPLDGSFYDPTDPKYKKLFRVIGYRFGKNASGHFCVPKLTDYLSVYNPTSVGVDKNAVPFVLKGPFVRQHQHTAAIASSNGGHSHTKNYILVNDGSGVPGTNGGGAGTSNSQPTSVAFQTNSDHSHSITQSSYEGVVNWRPESIISTAYIVSGGVDA